MYVRLLYFGFLTLCDSVTDPLHKNHNDLSNFSYPTPRNCFACETIHVRHSILGDSHISGSVSITLNTSSIHGARPSTSPSHEHLLLPYKLRQWIRFLQSQDGPCNGISISNSHTESICSGHVMWSRGRWLSKWNLLRSIGNCTKRFARQLRYPSGVSLFLCQLVPVEDLDDSHKPYNFEHFWDETTRYIGNLFSTNLFHLAPENELATRESFFGATVDSENQFFGSINDKKGLFRSRFGTLPYEDVCLESLLRWAETLPCRGELGVASPGLAKNALISSSYHAFGLRFSLLTDHTLAVKWEFEFMTTNADVIRKLNVDRQHSGNKALDFPRSFAPYDSLRLTPCPICDKSLVLRDYPDIGHYESHMDDGSSSSAQIINSPINFIVDHRVNLSLPIKAENLSEIYDMSTNLNSEWEIVSCVLGNALEGYQIQVRVQFPQWFREKLEDDICDMLRLLLLVPDALLRSFTHTAQCGIIASQQRSVSCEVEDISEHTDKSEDATENEYSCILKFSSGTLGSVNFETAFRKASRTRMKNDSLHDQNFWVKNISTNGSAPYGFYVNFQASSVFLSSSEYPPDAERIHLIPSPILLLQKQISVMDTNLTRKDTERLFSERYETPQIVQVGVPLSMSCPTPDFGIAQLVVLLTGTVVALGYNLIFKVIVGTE